MRSDGDAIVRTREGKTRRLNLADLENAPAVRDALAIAQARVADHARLKDARAVPTSP